MATETKAPDGLLTQTNLSGALSDVQTQDANWLTAASNNSDSVMIVSFPTPTGNPNTGAGLQNFSVQYRVTANASSVTFNAYLIESGVRLNGGATIDSWASTSTTGAVREITWDASLLGTADGSLVDLEVTAVKTGGSPGNRTTGEYGFVDWDVDYSAGATTFNQTVSGSITSSGISSQQLVLTQAIAGVLSLSGLVARTISKVSAGVMTLLGAPQKLVSTSIEGGVTLVGSVTKTISKVVQGAVTVLGSVSTQIVVLRLLVGSLTTSGSLAKTVSVLSNGVITATGSIIKLVIATKQGSITLSSTLLKLSTRVLSGVITLTGITVAASLIKQLIQGSTTLSSVLSGTLTAPPLESTKKFIRGFFNYIKR